MFIFVRISTTKTRISEVTELKDCLVNIKRLLLKVIFEYLVKARIHSDGTHSIISLMKDGTHFSWYRSITDDWMNFYKAQLEKNKGINGHVVIKTWTIQMN